MKNNKQVEKKLKDICSWKVNDKKFSISHYEEGYIQGLKWVLEVG